MPKQRQIRYLSKPRILADGFPAWYWKPSPQLRKQGWSTQCVGRDERTAVAAAMALNEQLDAWRKGTQPPTAQANTPAAKAAPPRLVRFGELCDRYEKSPGFLGCPPHIRALAPATQKEYKSRLRALRYWAEDGELAVRDIDRTLVLDLRAKLIQGGSLYRANAILRVLRIVLGFAVDQRIISVNPASAIGMPESPKRQQRILVDDLPWITDAARQLGHDHVALAVTLGFYSMQRQGDLLAATAFKFVEVQDISASARLVLAGQDGKVMGLQLVQGKTHKGVCVSMVPPARTALEAELAPRRTRTFIATWLIQRPFELGACHPRYFNTDWRACRDQALADVMAELRALRVERNWIAARRMLAVARRLRGLQYRDLRRSGMCWLRDLRVPKELIAANSGHTIKQTEKILDTYLPADTYAAAEGMAMAWAEQSRRDALQAPERESA